MSARRQTFPARPSPEWTPRETELRGSTMSTTSRRKVIANISLSLDGRTTGPQGPDDMGWVGPHALTDQARDTMVRITGATTVLVGRTNYEGRAASGDYLTREARRAARSARGRGRLATERPTQHPQGGESRGTSRCQRGRRGPWRSPGRTGPGSRGSRSRPAARGACAAAGPARPGTPRPRSPERLVELGNQPG